MNIVRVAAALSFGLAVAPSGMAATPPDPVQESGARTAEELLTRVTTVATGLEHPWSLAFLPDHRMLVTERPGRLRIVSPGGEVGDPLRGVPAVLAEGHGGLLDVALAPDFETTSEIYMCYAESEARGSRS